jgi:hypothetical protein
VRLAVVAVGDMIAVRAPFAEAVVRFGTSNKEVSCL